MRVYINNLTSNVNINYLLTLKYYLFNVKKLVSCGRRRRRGTRGRKVRKDVDANFLERLVGGRQDDHDFSESKKPGE
jgi:hypothetical protein